MSSVVLWAVNTNALLTGTNSVIAFNFRNNTHTYLIEPEDCIEKPQSPINQYTGNRDQKISVPDGFFKT